MSTFKLKNCSELSTKNLEVQTQMHGDDDDDHICIGALSILYKGLQGRSHKKPIKETKLEWLQ